MAGTNLPGGFGGLTRYNEEYRSKINLSPGHVVGYVLSIIAFIILLRIFFPVTA